VFKLAELVDFETAVDLGPVKAARLLGVAYVTYNQYRNGSREPPLYHQRHIEAVLALSGPGRAALIRKHTAHASE
jgi:hypothetical protein